MGLTKYRLDDLISRHDRRNTNLLYGATDVRGVTNTKKIVPTKAHLIDAPLNKFYIVSPNEFVFNIRTNRHGDRLCVGYNDTNTCYLLTFNYIPFFVTKKNILLSEYLNLFFQRNEFDRYVMNISFGSAQELFSWEDMCDVQITLPPLAIQQKYVDVYNAMLANQRAYENGLEDLNTAIEASIEEFKHTAPRVPVGKLLEDVDIRNRDGAITNVQGVNINKEFMPSVANLSTTDLTKYKIIKKNQFAANFMHVMRDGKIPFALYHDDDSCIISPAYPIFQLKSDDVLAEYIMLWLNRMESDRYAWFISDSSVRGGLEMRRFYEIEIPLPSPEKQQAVVNFYNARHLIQKNITALSNMLKDICPILIKGSLEEAEA